MKKFKLFIKEIPNFKLSNKVILNDCSYREVDQEI